MILPEDLPGAVLERGSPASLGADGYHRSVKQQKGELILAAVDCGSA